MTPTDNLDPNPVQPKIVPATEGWRWVLHGFALLRAYPGFWLLLLFFYWLALMLVGSLPVVGVVVLLLTVPALAAGFMVACDAVQKKSPPMPAHLFLPLRRDRRAQLILGMIYLGCMATLMGISSLIGGDVLMQLDVPVAAGGDVKGSAMELRTGSLVALVLYTPVMLAFWFAPALCYWHKLKPGKALFFSFFAGVRNSGAFLVYSLGWMVFALLLPMLAGAMLGAVLPRGPQGAGIAVIVLLPYILVVVCAMMLSFYSSFIGVFGEPGAPRGPTITATPPAV
jgi:hypothetical protein